MADVLATRRAMVTILEACVIAHVSRRTIYNWLEAGKIEYVRTPTGAVRIYEDSLFRPGPRVFVPPEIFDDGPLCPFCGAVKDVAAFPTCAARGCVEQFKSKRDAMTPATVGQGRHA